jgi:thiol:disulfide interchange protein DsbD
MVVRALAGCIALFSIVALGQARPLAADEAFRLTAERDDASGAIRLTWAIADGYYLYRDNIVVMEPGRGPVELRLSRGSKKSDGDIGVKAIYRGRFSTSVVPSDSEWLWIQFQGCEEKGICYPPITKMVDLDSLSVTEGDD